MSFTLDLNVTGTVNNILGGGIAAYFNNITDPDNIYVMGSGIVIKNDDITEPQYANSRIWKYNKNTKTTEEIAFQNNLGAANMSAIGTSGHSFIVSGRFDFQGESNVALIYDIDGGTILSVTSIPRLYSNSPHFQEGASCALATMVSVPLTEYCAIGTPRFGNNLEDFQGKVNIYKRTQPSEEMIHTISIVPNAPMATNRNFFGYTLQFVRLNSEMQIAISAPQFYNGTVKHSGYIEFFDPETGFFLHRINGASIERNTGWGMTSNNDSVSDGIFAYSFLNTNENGTQKRIYVYKDLTGSEPSDRQTITEEFSASPAINVSSDGLTIASGITRFTEDVAGKVNVYKRNIGGTTDFMKASVITPPEGNPFGYSVSIIAPNDPTTEEYTVITGANPLPVSTNGSPTFFGEQRYYSAFLQEFGSCYEEIFDGVLWPTTLEDNSIDVLSCGIEGYIPDPTFNSPPFSRTCIADEAIWDSPSNGGCIRPTNTCDVIIENNIRWPVTTKGTSAAGVCLSGTHNPENIALIRKCQNDGTWASTLFSCFPAEPVCQAQTVDNIEWPRVEAGATARGNCQVPFVAPENKPLERECGQLGVWEPSDAFCVQANNSLTEQQYYATTFGTILGIAVMITILVLIFMYIR